MDGYLGEVKMFAGTFAPVNWAFCWGQLLQVSQYSSLYALLGTQFGGDGINDFGVPDLRGRIPVGSGTGPGLTPRSPGQMSGAENVTLSVAQLPTHTHIVQCDGTSTATVDIPTNNIPAKTTPGSGYATVAATATMNANMLSGAGGNQPHNNMPPWGCLNYIICVEGLWPPRS